MSALPLPIAALAAASHVAPSLVEPFFRRMMLNPRRHVRPPPVLSLPPADQRIDLGDGLIAWRWGEGPAVMLVSGGVLSVGGSIVHVCDAGLASTLPAASVARTLKVCEPVPRAL